jgi:predicted RNase H-like HicB family nuclease
MPKLEYAIYIEPLSAEDGGGFLATVPDLPGRVSDGETREEAARNVEGAILRWRDQARKMGRAAPEPKSVSARCAPPSVAGKVAKNRG